MSGPHPEVDGAVVAAQVDAAVRALDLPVWTVGPNTVSVAVHEDAQNQPRVLFVMNPTPANENVTIPFKRSATLIDLLDESRHPCGPNGALVFVPARTVRMLRIDLT